MTATLFVYSPTGHWMRREVVPVWAAQAYANDLARSGLDVSIYYPAVGS